METILIATDFSKAARNATMYGFELARTIKAKVILFTAWQAPVAFTEGAFYISPDEQEKECYERLFEEAESIDPRRTVALETQCTQGPVNSSILAAVANNNVSYIVVGMKDRGKEIRKYIGSTVTDLCKRATVPLIVVPANAAFSVPKSIALASDIAHDADIHILEPLKTIAKKFDSKIQIVRVITSSMDEVVERLMQSQSLRSLFSDVVYSFKYIKADNIAKALNGYVGQQSVDMVAVIPHEHNLFERLFTRSVTKDLIFHTHVPLLVLSGKMNITKPENEMHSSAFLYDLERPY